MKKMILILSLFVSIACFGDTLQTIQPTPLRVSYADSNDTALDPNTSSWAVCKNWVDIPSNYNGMKIQFYAYDPNDPNNDTFSYQFYVANNYGNAELVAYGAVTVGGSKLSYNPVSLAKLNSGAIDPNYAWADTITATSDWLDGNGVTKQNNGGSDGVASFIFDRQSAKKAWCRIYSMSNAYLEVYVLAYGY